MTSSKIIPQILQTMEYGDMSDTTNLVTTWLSREKFGPFINGKWLESNEEKGTKAVEVRTPNTGDVLTIVTDSCVQDVDSALQSSVDAKRTWRKLSGYERNRCLHRISKQLQQNSQLISELLAVSIGIHTRITRNWDVPLAANVFKYYAGWAQLIQDEEKENGIAAIVTSATCPLSVMAWLIAPVLAAGGTVCLKPSHQHPLLAFLFADVCVKAGLPSGVVNLLPGASDVGDYLLRSSDVKHIGYFGSTSVGRNIRQNVAGSSKTLSMLVDSKSTMVVFDTADIDSAVEEAVKAAWFYQGQVPWSLKNMLVQESIFSEVVKKLESHVSTLSTGLPINKMADIGPAVKKNICEEVAKVVNKARTKGVQIIEAKSARSGSDSFFFTPTVLVGAGAEVNNVLNDYFNTPILTVTPFRTAKEGIALANNSLSGLAASVWTENTTLAFDVIKNLQVGIVWLNCHGEFYVGASFTPRKKSGHGSFCGKEGMLQYRTHEESEDENEIKIACNCISPTVNANRNDVGCAVSASLNAKNSWEKKSFSAKAEILSKLADLVQSRACELIRKTNLSESQISWCAERLAYWASVCDKQQLSSYTCVGDKHIISYKEPVGIVVAIIPHCDQKLAVDILGSSICFGNLSVIVSCSLLLMELRSLLHAVNVPAGAITVLTGNDAVIHLTQHQAIDAIWYRKEDSELRKVLNTAAAVGMKKMWKMPSAISQEMWEFNSTVSKMLWVPASSGLPN